MKMLLIKEKDTKITTIPQRLCTSFNPILNIILIFFPVTMLLSFYSEIKAVAKHQNVFPDIKQQQKNNFT